MTTTFLKIFLLDLTFYIIPIIMVILVIIMYLLQFLNETSLVELNLHGSFPSDLLLQIAAVDQVEVSLSLISDNTWNTGIVHGTGRVSQILEAFRKTAGSQNCYYAQKRRICRKNRKYALDENFMVIFAPFLLQLLPPF